MSEDNPDILDEIAQEIDEITEEQKDSSDDKVAQEGDDDFDPEDYKRNMEDYDGGW